MCVKYIIACIIIPSFARGCLTDPAETRRVRAFDWQVGFRLCGSVASLSKRLF
jgi:hypothetical protein